MRFDLGTWLREAPHLWRSSLQLRMVTIAVVLTGIAVTGIGSYMSYSIRTNLYQSRLQQVVTETQRAQVAAQNVFAGATDDTSGSDLERLLAPATSAILGSTSSPGGTPYAILRVPGQAGSGLLEDNTSPGFDDTLLSPELRNAVIHSTDGRPYSQSVALSTDSGLTPGIVVGTILDVPQSGEYQLYLVFSLADVQQNLDFVQQTLLLGGIALVLIIGGIASLVVRLVITPVRLAAETSEKLAAGQLEQRIPEHGQDVIATLARSFNGMADSLQKQITQLADLSLVQQRFVSDVSHELRTPLTTIRLAGDMLYDQRESFEPSTSRTAELLHTQVDRFELLLADLLEMSRFDARAARLETEPTNLVRLVEDAIDSVSTLAATKGSQLRLEAPGGYFEADVDARRVRRILQNLLGNAIDHGEGEPIVVYVDSDAHAVAIAVRDYGIGMTSADMERVFDRFWRADPSRQRTTGGTGLGLAISLEDAALHGGWLQAWSSPGRGSCFRLTLPRERGMALSRSPLDLPPDDSVRAETTGGTRQ